MIPRTFAALAVAGLLGAGIAARAPQSAPTALARQATPAADVYNAITSTVVIEGWPVPVTQPELSLAMVTIPPGASIGEHDHPGTQISTVTQGTLTYTVVTREALMRPAGSPPDAPFKPIRAGRTVDLTVGDALMEFPGQIHKAENRGDEPVVLWLATLFPDGAPRAIPAAATPEATPAS